MQGTVVCAVLHTLLPVVRVALGVTLKTSLINHPQAGSLIFADMWLGKGDVARYYYGSLVFENMTRVTRR